MTTTHARCDDCGDAINPRLVAKYRGTGWEGLCGTCARPHIMAGNRNSGKWGANASDRRRALRAAKLGAQ